MNKLTPIRHLQKDFFICDVFDTYRDDLASMEHPLFSLSTKPDYRVLNYSHNGNSIQISPSPLGLPTIHDKDILLYVASSLIQSMNEGKQPTPNVRFTAYDFLIATNRKTDGRAYKQLREGLKRLRQTDVETNIRTGGNRVEYGFSLINHWQIITEDKTGRMVAVEVQLSDWFYNSIVSMEVLTINPDYFRLRKPTERRLYELARKHCGSQVAWKIKLENLKTKLGTTTPLKTLRFNLKALAESNHLPDYNISLDGDVVLVSRKEEAKKPEYELLPKHVTKKDIEKHARVGESYEQARTRLQSKDKVAGLKQALKSNK